MRFATSLLRLALIANLTACITGDDFADEDNATVLSSENYGQAEQAVGTCQYTLTGAAITKQISSIGEPTQLLVELVTITNKPYSMKATSMTFPQGLAFVSLSTTSCTDTGTGWKCRHQGVVEDTYASSGTGAYSMSFTPVADAGSGCGNAPTQTINFSLQTESWTPYGLDVLGSEAVLFSDWNYGGQAYGLQAGYSSFNGVAVNDVASSLKLMPGYMITLYENANWTGASVTLTADSSFLSSFNDVASSAWVRRIP